MPQQNVTPDDLRARVASRIRETAKRRGMTMVRVADESGVSRATVWAVLAGRRAATTDVLAKLAAVLNVDPGELVRMPRRQS